MFRARHCESDECLSVGAVATEGNTINPAINSSLIKGISQ
tara:strand:+ start:626 stop:745 length:120 start_codon:yes stop_codon:yes gene_type:complete